MKEGCWCCKGNGQGSVTVNALTECWPSPLRAEPPAGSSAEGETEGSQAGTVACSPVTLCLEGTVDRMVQVWAGSEDEKGGRRGGKAWAPYVSPAGGQPVHC